MKAPSCILTIAGSDSGGGAGIQADLKTIAMLGGYGASVVTALTAQNTAAVTGIHSPSSKFVAKQLRTVLDDIEVHAAKTGMLFSEPIIKAIAPILSKKAFPLVVDPVCVATSGAKLLKSDAVEAMKKLMFPMADLLTPNIPETELFTGVKIIDREDVFKAARLLLAMGPKAVLIKGGHVDSYAVTDWFAAEGAEPTPFMQQRVETDCTHGTGCTLSAAIASGLGQGMEMGDAVKRAQKYLNLALRASSPIGEGGGPPNHLAPLVKERGRCVATSDLDDLGRRLVQLKGLHRFLPRVRTNAALALPYADDDGEVIAFSGGVIATRRGDVLVAGHPEFGASVRTAATLLTARRLRPDISCAMTLSMNDDVKRAIDSCDFHTVWMDRDRKPDYIPFEDGKYEEWGTFEALRTQEDIEEVKGVVDPGGVGSEPLVRLLANDAESLFSMVRRLVESQSQAN